MELYERIGQRIKKARQEQDVGQKVLAAALGYTPSTISQYENGKRCILLTDLEKIAAVLSRPLAYFISPEGQGGSKKKAGFYVTLSQYRTIGQVSKLKNKLNRAESEAKKQKLKIKKLESKIVSLLARIAEQAKITNQTALLYNELKRSEEKNREIEAISAAHKTAANIAYQLNNPLTSLLGFVQILVAETNTSDQRYGDFKKLETNVRRCIKIIAELINSFEPSSV